MKIFDESDNENQVLLNDYAKIIKKDCFKQESKEKKSTITY